MDFYPAMWRVATHPCGGLELCHVAGYHVKLHTLYTLHTLPLQVFCSWPVTMLNYIPFIPSTRFPFSFFPHVLLFIDLVAAYVAYVDAPPRRWFPPRGGGGCADIKCPNGGGFEEQTL